MTKQEFRDYLFDMINKSEEIPVRDIEVDEEIGNIIVEVFDGSRFLVRCEKE